MAQLRDLIVNGASRFLGVVNFNNEAIFNEGVTLNETLTLLKNADAIGSSYAAPALVIGPYTAQHLEFDTNEIMSKSAAGTPTTLYLNNDGGQVVIGKDGLKVGNGTGATAKNTGDLQVAGGLSTTAASFFGGSVTIDSILSVTGNTTIGNATSDTHSIVGDVIHNGNVYFANNTVYKITNSGDAKFNNLNAIGNVSLGNSSTNDTIAINGSTTITGATKVIGTLTAQGNIIPSANDTYSLGSSGYKWKELYVDSTAYIGDGVAASGKNTGDLQIAGGFSAGETSYIDGALTTTKRLTTLALTITDTNAIEHIKFLRKNYNYITAPAEGKIGFIVNGSDPGSASCELTIEDGSIFPGTTDATTLGQSSKRWSAIYVKNIDATGTLVAKGNATIGNAASNAHTIKGSITLTGHLIPGAATTYDLGSSSKYWRKLYVGNGDDSISTTTGAILVSGGIGVTKSITIGGEINLSRKSSSSSGRISFYDPAYYTWFNYMSNSTAGAAPTGGQPSTYGDVTGWALRSLIENSSSYGWIWESAQNAAAANTTTAPVPIMALSSNSGNLRIKGDFSAEGGDVTLGSAGTYYINTGTSKLNALTTVGQITAGSHIIPDSNNANDLGSASNKWQNLYVSKNIVVGNGTAASAVNTGNVQITGGLSASKNSYFDAQVIIKKAVVEYDATDECLYFSFNI